MVAEIVRHRELQKTCERQGRSRRKPAGREKGASANFTHIQDHGLTVEEWVSNGPVEDSLGGPRAQLYEVQGSVTAGLREKMED